MDPNKEREDLCNTGPDDETVIREKKRLRRVSFAENTEVHIFEREDEDSGPTPPQPPPSPLSSQPNPKLLGLLAQSKEENADDGEDDEHREFRDFDSSSPGSAVSSAASATSNDEENFFGPVSASFIRLGRQDSAASDEHDITLDSTAFSMHFQSLAQSDSGVSCKTPTPSFVGKHSMPTNSGSDMVMTGKKHIHYTLASGGDSSGGRDSSDMSLVGRNPSDKYDFGKLSPTLEAMLAQLAQTREDPSHASASGQMSVSKASNHFDSESKAQELHTSKGVELNNSDTPDNPIKMGCDGNSKFYEADASPATTPIKRSIKDCIFNTVDPLLPDAPTSQQNQTLPESIQRQGTHPGNLNQHDYCIKLSKVEQRQESSDTRATNVKSLRGNGNGSINLDKLRSICDKDFLYQTSQKEYRNVRDLITPLRRGTSLISPLGSSDLSFLTSSVPTKTAEKFPELNPVHRSASPCILKTATAIRLEKRFGEIIVQDSVRKETESLSESNMFHSFLRKGPLSFTHIQSSNGVGHTDLQSHQTLHQKFSAQDVGSSGRKRKGEAIDPTDNNNNDEIGNKNPKVTIQTRGCASESWLNNCPVGNHEAEMSGGYESQGHWINVLKELPGAIERLLSPSIGKLNNRELDILEDMLARMQKATKYEKLSTLVQFQRPADLFANSHQGRLAEARCLEKTLVYEQAKLILLRTKQERLRKRVQQVHSGIQEAQNLKLRVKNVPQNGAKVDQNKDVILPSPSVDLNCKNVEIYNRVIAKRLELGSLDINIKNLTKSLLASCKIKEEPSPDECIVLINDYLRKRSRCRLLQKELQLYDIKRPKWENGHLTLILNYYDVLHQSFTMSHGSLAKLATVTRLNDAKIMKCFPNMNASTAFSFIFDGATRNLVNSKSLPVETQMTRSLLHCLLIVIGEVQLAGIELSNLIQTSFLSPCDPLLELELCFVDFKTGNKVQLIIDITSLNRGVYPLEVHPRITMKRPSELLLTETEAAVRALKPGHSMIIRLCKCVSQVLGASSRWIE